MKVINRALKNCISKSHFGLNISVKLNEMLIDAFVVLYGLRPKVIAQKDASKGP